MSDSLPSSFEAACGLGHSLGHLEEIKPDILLMPREQQAKYADAVCVAMAYDSRFLSEQFNSYCFENPNYEFWNTTSVGNLAYILLHSPISQDQRTSMEKMMAGYSSWQRQQPLMNLMPACVVA